MSKTFSGKLVPQDPNDQPDEVLLRKIHEDSKKIVFDKNNLPKNWIKTKIGMICTIVSGIGFPKIYQGCKNEKYPFYKVGDISKTVQYGNFWLYDADNYVSQKVCGLLKGNPVPGGTLVFAKIGEALKLNRRAITSKHSLFDNNVMGVIPNSNIEILYLYYFFTTVKLGNISRSTTVPSIRKTDVELIQIPLPPLNEQKRIVQKIESILSQIDAGKKRLDNVKKLLKQAKQSISKLELVRLMKKYGLQQLDNICIKITDGSHNSPSNSHMGEIPYVTAKNIRPKKLDVTNITYITKKDHKEIFARCNPEKGDILYTKDGTVGYAVVNEYDFEFSLLSSVALLKPDHRILDSHYLENILNNPVMYNSVIEKMSGTALRRIILKKIKKIQIPLPPLNEQKRIVSKIESILGRIDANFVKTKMLTLIHDTI